MVKMNMIRVSPVYMRAYVLGTISSEEVSMALRLSHIACTSWVAAGTVGHELAWPPWLC
jgi:hypothetical protein